MFNRGETYARAANFDDSWSIHSTSTTLTLYEGATYATRDTSNDETYDLPASVANSYTGDINFAKLTANPSATPTLTLTSNANATRTVTLNAKGMVDY